ncbi:hypothetical protein ACLOJK_029819 [Asimina triloba]
MDKVAPNRKEDVKMQEDPASTTLRTQYSWEVACAPPEHRYGAPPPSIGASSPTAVAVSGDTEDDGEIRSPAVSCDGRRAASPLRRTADLGVRTEHRRGAAKNPSSPAAVCRAGCCGAAASRRPRAGNDAVNPSSAFASSQPSTTSSVDPAPTSHL